MDAESAGLLGGIIAVSMGLVKIVEMFAKPLIEERHEKKRSNGKPKRECALSYEDRAHLMTVQPRSLESLERNNVKQLEVLEKIHREHGMQLQRLVDATTNTSRRRDS
jgi:hypothetical protein